MKKQAKGSQFTRFFVPVLDVLKEIGGSGAAAEVTDLVIEKMVISEEEQTALLKNGESRVRNQIRFARLYLVRAGYMSSSKRGMWSLTDKGMKTDTDMVDVKKIEKEVRNFLDVGKNTAEESEELEFPQIDYRTCLLNLIQSLPSSGFERLCQRLLRESGFEDVVVTGKTGDGGIDGIGMLKINPFVRFNVLFQCKRYQGTVSPSQIRDFRGAMMGRTDKGIIITTGTFTTDAKKEARREGVPPIELVDAERLLDMFEQLELGLTPQKTFEVNEQFFEDFAK